MGFRVFFNATENKFTHRSFWVCANARRRQISGRHCRVKGQVRFPFWWMSPLALNHVVYLSELPPATNEVPVAWRKDLTSFDFKWQQPAYPVQMQVGGGEDHGGFCRQERLSVGTCEAGRSKSCLIKLSKLVDAWFGGGYKKEKESFHRGGARAPRKKTAAAVNLLGWFPVGCSPKEGRFQLQLQIGDGTYHNKS